MIVLEFQAAAGTLNVTAPPSGLVAPPGSYMLFIVDNRGRPCDYAKFVRVVQRTRIGPTPRVACATNQGGDLHICAIDQADGLWHTIRLANGTWPFAFGDVQTAISGP